MVSAATVMTMVALSEATERSVQLRRVTPALAQILDVALRREDHRDAVRSAQGDDLRVVHTKGTGGARGRTRRGCS